MVTPLNADRLGNRTLESINPNPGCSLEDQPAESNCGDTTCSFKSHRAFLSGLNKTNRGISHQEPASKWVDFTIFKPSRPLSDEQSEVTASNNPIMILTLEGEGPLQRRKIPDIQNRPNQRNGEQISFRRGERNSDLL